MDHGGQLRRRAIRARAAKATRNWSRARACIPTGSQGSHGAGRGDRCSQRPKAVRVTGAPDFVFLQRGSKNLIFGWAEAKDITADLTKIEKTEQLQRYSGYSNLYLTNYIEFRFYSSGTRYADVVIGEIKAGRIKLLPENYEMLAGLLSGFLAQKPQPITSGVRLAQVMGGIARRIRTAVDYYLSVDSDKNAELLGIYRMIKELLVHDLDKDRFGDMYAQTLVYGLFAARYNDTSPDDFTRAEARDLVPKSNPFLQQFFDHIAGANFDWRLARIVDELCEIFAVSSVREIVHQHLVQPSLTGDQTDDMDPIIHFYEDFLQAYDPDQRKNWAPITRLCPLCASWCGWSITFSRPSSA